MKFVYLLLLITTISCNAQEKFVGRYIGNKSTSTMNSSFINNTFLFVDNKNDTINANVKVPFDTSKMEIINRGIYYNCLLKPEIVYTISLKKLNKDELPQELNSYYKTNANFNNSKGKYIEIKKDTKYLYHGYYERYIDIDNVLYEITGISPDSSCFFPH